MAHFFSYDSGENKHQFYTHELKNEKGEVVGYLPLVSRWPKEGGMVEQVSWRLLDLRMKLFTEEKMAREYAIEYFQRLGSEDDIKNGFLRVDFG